MAETTSKQSDVQTITAESPVVPGRPQEQLEVDEPNSEEDIVYPSGLKLVMSMTSLLVTLILTGLDLTIVAVTVPSLTNEFKTVEDIGWYSAAYGIVYAACLFLVGKLYTLFLTKQLFIGSVCVFELGSLICTVAPNSKTFILGRAIAGLGNSGVGGGVIVILSQCFPKEKRPLWTGFAGSVMSVAMVSSPILGGVLIDALSWRACFGINLPLGVGVVVLLFFGFTEVQINPDTKLPWKAKLARIDALGTLLMMPAIVCLLMALQWGGIKYGWNNPIIISLLVASALMLAAFGWRQHRLQDKGTLPPRILKHRSILAGAWFSTCVNGALAVTEYYVSIYFQGVKGYSATKSGVFILPMLIGLMVASTVAGIGVTKIGYYTPFMIITTVVAPVASGLLTTVKLDDGLVKPLCLLGLLGTSIGLGLQVPLNAVQNVLSMKDLPIGMAVTGFAGAMGSALFITTSATLFQNRLAAEITQYAPGTNVTQLAHVGLSDIRKVVGAERLRQVLFGYDKAVAQTLYIPVALTAATLIASVLMEWRSVKKKQS